MTVLPDVSLAINVYTFTFVTDSISYSWFNTSAVIRPPRLNAPLIVTKSPLFAPWVESVAVIVELPFVAANVIPLVVVALIGVMS